jgi:deoxyribose-phosphate aldolase
MGGADDFLARARAAPIDAETARRILRLVHLPALDADGEAPLAALCGRAVDAGIAALRLDPGAIPFVRRHLGETSLRLVTVANLDAGEDIARAAAEVAAGVAAGADEVEVLGPAQAILEGDVGLIGELVEACRVEAAGSVLSVGLDVGILEDAAPITAAARAAIMAGAHGLSISRATGPPALDATAVLLAVLSEAEGRIGIGVAGVDEVQSAAGHLHLIDHTMGPDWATPVTVRFVSSSLLDDALDRVAGGGRHSAD